MCVSRRGSGIFAAMVDSWTFSDAVMGGSMVEPSDTQRAVYELEFAILEHILALGGAEAAGGNSPQ